MRAGGRLVRGRTLSCMEIGHLPVLADGPLCGCGQRGCLEAVASRLAISAAAAAAAFRGEAPCLLKEAGTDLAAIRSKTLARSVAGGDEAVRRILEQSARWIGVGVAALVNLLAPEVVILGGGLVDALPELFRDEVAAAANQRVMPSFRGSFAVKVAELGDDATVLGAAALAADAAGE
jgi:glucokinase